MDVIRIPVLKLGNGYFKAILLNGQETVFAGDERELVGRLKFRTGLLGVHARQVVERALDVRR